MADRPCTACAGRDAVTTLREPYFVDASFDPTLGLTLVGDELYTCPACGQLYRRGLEPATRFHDYDTHVFTKLDASVLAPPRRKKVRVVRCPKCGATDAASDESRSYVDLSYMQCQGCGHGELVDSWQVSFDWNLEIEIAVDATELPSHVAPLHPDDELYVSMARARATKDEG